MILRILIVALVAIGGWGVWRDRVAASWEAEALRAQRAEGAYRLRAKGCAARLNKIEQDKESDNAVDNMSDLTAIPDRWLRLE